MGRYWEGVPFHPQPLRQQAAPPGEAGVGAAPVPRPPEPECPLAALLAKHTPSPEASAAHRALGSDYGKDCLA